MRKIILGVAVSLAQSMGDMPAGFPKLKEYVFSNMLDAVKPGVTLVKGPLLLGSGKLLFSHLPGRVPLQLLDTKTYNTGLVPLTYKISL